jgi:hypothetical protein
MIITKERYNYLIGADLAESFEIFLQQKLYIEAVAVSRDGEYRVIVAFYNLDGLDIFNASEFYQLEAREAIKSAKEIIYREFPTHTAAFAFCMKYSAEIVATFEDQV